MGVTRLAILAFLFGRAAAASGTGDLRVESKAITGGAELLTVFGRLEATPREAALSGEVPLVSVLRDTLGDSDPDNDRLRYVWVLTAARPNLLQRVAAALPFFYWRPDARKNCDGPPAPVFDLSAASRQVWTGLAGALTQAMMLDPNGALIRTSTRSYRNNARDYRRLHLLEGVAVLSQLDDRPEVNALLSEPELLEIQARLTLASKALGGLVNDASLPEAYLKERSRMERTRSHNWELLRQRAEANGLYFQPFGLNGSATHALLWIARPDLQHPEPRRFDPQFLKIADPWRDPRLRTRNGYAEVRDGVEMIPLALYSLEYPRVPLLMVDFRNARAPKRREMMRRAAADTVSSVLGISKWGNWPYFAGQWTWSFVTRRHGAPNDRAARLRAYSQLRQWLALDDTVSASLREALQKRLEIAGVNPLEDTLAEEVKLARRQYDALLRYAEAPDGLAARLERDRRAELARFVHGGGALVVYRAATLMTLGLYTHRERVTPEFEERLARERRVARNMKFLESVAETPQTEIVWNMDEVRKALDTLARSELPARSARLLARIYAQTRDEETRALCKRALETLDAGPVGQ